MNRGGNASGNETEWNGAEAHGIDGSTPIANGIAYPMANGNAPAPFPNDPAQLALDGHGAGRATRREQDGQAQP